ncbi:MAG: methylated-DNA--[protein]-cysteine S-methyltransferase [Planctomycetota bacterium]
MRTTSRTSNRESAEPIAWSVGTSSVGRVLVAVDSGQALVGLRFLAEGSETSELESALEELRSRFSAIEERPRLCAKSVAAVREFVTGKSKVVDLPVAVRGTPFQESVWKVVRRIPYGKTLTYRELAVRIGRPTAWRAVARANATNPVALVVPCHRVIGSDGKATGYTGGVAIKQALLELEASVVSAGVRTATTPAKSHSARA